jgi:aspartate aminotransferase
LRKTIQESRKLGGNPTKFIINFPNNPTGLSMPDENMKQVAEILQEEGILLISDEIYGFTSYDEIYREREGKKDEDDGVFVPSYRSFARFTPNNVIVTSGLSKAQSLGGWRLGFGIIPKGLVDKKNNNFPLFTLLTMLQAETTSCIPAPISQACVLAFKNDPCVEEQIKLSTRIHEVVSRYMATEIRKMGVKCPIPAGAFYVFPEWTEHAEKIKAVFPKIQNAQDLADHFAETYGLIALPSSCFLCEKSRLALRCALQDYNGKVAFQNAARLFTTKELSEEEYVKTYMPNLAECLVCFRDFSTKVGIC